MQNFTYHTHNHEQDFDGHQSAEEMIAAAEEKGFAEIGVSNHLICHKNLRIENGYQPMFRQDFKSGEECYKKHIELIRQAAEKHRIKVRVGFEVDFFPSAYWRDNFEKMLKNLDVDYIIGSKHCVNGTGYENGVDCSKEITKKIVQSQFSNDFLLYAKNYYEDIIQMADWDEVDIIGHFDLIMKYNEDQSFLSFSNRKYINMACDALDCLLSKGKIIEVNTGAMARGYRSQAYPEVHLLEYIASKNGKIILNSDCHNRKDLDAGYDSTLASLEKIGFKEMMVLTDCGFKAVDIKQFKRG